ncbi:hypothetical protein JX265_009900 [Neoarthrinium moseri]|uniref:Zn(2)-C6 fungal-type domain-containing protein n=1 Tax=Neoarthrinium moseri TaxID=1658444 RepID=A0A9P9WFG7_9PEZI|nr:hypothetical protein JX265_009900 [Neoarthrinium moseri]
MGLEFATILHVDECHDPTVYEPCHRSIGRVFDGDFLRNATMEPRKQVNFACESCREGKRKCDAEKPQCSRCKRQGKHCVYATEDKPKRRKYWDEEYVQSLENQVKTLLAALEASTSQKPTAPRVEDGPYSGQGTASTPAETYQGIALVEHPVAIPPQRIEPTEPEDRSLTAMEELSVMMWRTNIGDGVTIIGDSPSGPHRVDPAETPRPADFITPPMKILDYCGNQELIHGLADLFLENINSEHQFTSYKSSDFLVGYPYQSFGYTFLHSAMLATGAVFSDRADAAEISDAFAQFAESLVFICFRNDPGIQVLQGLCMLSWRSLALGRDHFGWTFISMAAGLCVHLRLHVLALDECSARTWQPQVADIRTFWMFYLIDRTAISILGRNCVLPWRRVNVPNFEGTIDPLTADIAQISFTWQCKLWFLHDEQMDQIFASKFDSMPAQQQIHLLVSTHEALNGFFKSRDRRLDLKGRETCRHVLFFHLAYQMALLITLPPFLRCFCAPNADHSGDSEFMLLILRSLTSAASNTIRLVRVYRDAHPEQWRAANPVVIHHLLSAAIVHMMNATSKSTSLRTRSTMWLRVCMDLLSQLKSPWPNRANKTINMIRVLAERWGVLGALPVRFSSKVAPYAARHNTSSHSLSNNAPTSAQDITHLQSEDTLSATAMEEASFCMADHVSAVSYPNPELVGPEALDFGAGAQQKFGNFLSMDDTNWLSEGEFLDNYALWGS